MPAPYTPRQGQFLAYIHAHTRLHRQPPSEMDMTAGSRVELGRTERTRSMARALDEGGTVWEGKERYQSMVDLLRDLNEGTAQWNEEVT